MNATCNLRFSGAKTGFFSSSIQEEFFIAVKKVYLLPFPSVVLVRFPRDRQADIKAATEENTHPEEDRWEDTRERDAEKCR